MAESTRSRRSSRLHQPVKKGIPAWIYIAGGLSLVVIVIAGIIYPIYHRSAVVKAALSLDANERRWAAREAVPIRIKIVDPLLEAGVSCQPEAAVDYMELLIKLTPPTSSVYMQTKVRRFAKKWADDESPEKRLAAARGLTTYFDEENKTLLLELIRDPEKKVRHAVASNLLVPCYASTEIALTGISDTDMQVRRKAAGALKKVATPDAARMLLSKVNTSNDVGLKATIIRVLARHDLAPKLGSSAFAPLLKDPSPDVRKEVIIAITHAADRNVTPLLIKALDDPSSEVRHEIIMCALYARKQEVGLAAAERLLFEPSSEVKIRTLKAVGPLRLKAAKDKIIALALKTNETKEVRLAALGAVSSLNLRKPEECYPMVEMLIPIMEDPDREIADKARAVAAGLVSGRKPRTPDGWRQWMEDKKKVIGLLNRIKELVADGDMCMETKQYRRAEASYRKASDRYNDVIELCAEREKDGFWRRQTELGKKTRHAAQRAEMNE